jgi:ABC-type branched-subunit amino acid transport system ATPase component
MRTASLRIEAVSKHFGAVVALSDVSCSVDKGEIVGLIGPNGAGKSTLFNVICGYERAEKGKVLLNGRNITSRQPYTIAKAGVGRTFQKLRLIRQISVLENVLVSFRNQPGEQLGNVFFAQAKSARVEAKNGDLALELLHGVGLESKAGAMADELSFGQQKLLSIVCAYAGAGTVLLLDEPVAGVAPHLIDTILEGIRKFAMSGRAVLVIEHNVDAVLSLCHRVIFLAAGVNVCEGPPEQVRRDPRVIESYLGTSHVA